MGQTRSREALTIDAHVGLRLRQLRQERGLSLAALAQTMGHTTGQAVSKYEQGAAFPAALMFRTSDALGVPISAFFEGVRLEGAGGAGVAEPPAEPFDAEALGDSTEARKIAAILRATPRPQHAAILRVVKAMAAAG